MPAITGDSPCVLSRLQVLIVSGIWPPDVGGPASHGPELGRYLTGRGHRVSAFVSSDAAPEPAGFPVTFTRRDRLLPVRMAAGGLGLLRASYAADVMYATGIYHRAGLASRVAGTPLVVKLANDPAYERARNRGWFAGTLEDFQRTSGSGPHLSMLCRMRNTAVDQANRIIVPSEYLARIVRKWRVRAPITVIHNPAVVGHQNKSREALRAQFGMRGLSAVFAGRFVLQKNLGLVVSAMTEVEGLSLWLVGDGPERSALESAISENDIGDRVRLVRAVSQDKAGQWMHAADLTVLPSSWENFPHSVVESLELGTPVIGSAVGGVPEILTHDHNGWLIPAGDRETLIAALRRFVIDDEARERLRAEALAGRGQFLPGPLFAKAERELEAAISQRERPTSSASTAR